MGFLLGLLIGLPAGALLSKFIRPWISKLVDLVMRR